ncbi:MAG: hypothetical protein JNJ54_23830 [Myxococcaceae bacterium]|nr:hypothetical protein [Myxococcaceae bacterium]
MLTLALFTALGATPSIAAPGFTCTRLEPTLCDAYLEHFVANLSARGLKVTTKNDMAELIGVERQKQLLGCSATSGSCLAELAGALGVSSILSGTIARTESGFLSTLKVIDASNGATKWSATTRVDTEKELFGFFDVEAGTLVSTIAPDARPVRGGVPTIVKWVPAMAGAVAVGVGIGLLGASMGEAQHLREQIANPQPLGKVLVDEFTVEQDIVLTAAEGRGLQLAGWISVGLGGAAVVSSFLWWLLTPSSTVSTAVVPIRGGGLVSFSMELP